MTVQEAAPDVALLAADNVTVQFGGVVALDDVGISVAPRSVVGLIGPNGAGKTTLFGVLSGLLRPRSGKVYMSGTDVTRQSPHKRAGRGLARTFQRPELFVDLNVRQHLSVAYRAHHHDHYLIGDLLGFDRRASAGETERVDQLLELLGLEQLALAPVTSLSLGNARLVEVARAAATDAQVLLLDEPSSGLDKTETAQLASVFRRLNEVEGTSLLLVEHDMDFVFDLAETITVLDFGLVIAKGTPDEVRADPTVQAAYLGEAF